MHSEIINKPVIKFSESVNSYFDELIATLFWQNYFGFMDSAFQYVVGMRNYIETYISILPAYLAPHYFSKYQTGMKYIRYTPNNSRNYRFYKADNPLCN